MVHIVKCVEKLVGAPASSVNSRTVFSAEVRDRESDKPRCTWRLSGLGQEQFVHVHSFALSHPSDGRFVIAYCNNTTVHASLVKLDAVVDPLPLEMHYDRTMRDFNWKDSPSAPIVPKPQELGMELGFRYQIRLDSVAKTGTGWRIDAHVYDPNDRITLRASDGSITIIPNPVPTLRFAILTDEQCRSHKVEVLKAKGDKSN